MATAMTVAPATTVWNLLAERDFRRLLASQFVGQAGDGIAQALLATELVLDPLAEGTPGRILALFVLTLLPYSVVSPFMGVLVDRWDRRRLLIATNLGRAALLMTLPLWASAFPDDVGPMVAVLGLLGLGRLFHTTKGAVLPLVLHEHDLVRGNTISSVGGTLAVLAGAAFGLWLSELFAARRGLTATGAVYLIAALYASLIRADVSHRDRIAAQFWKAVRSVTIALGDGARAIWSRRPAWVALTSVFAMRTVTILVAIGVILTIKTEFTGQKSAGGVALGAAGAGAFLASLAAPKLGDRLTNTQMIVLGFAIAGLGTVALGGSATLPAVVALMVCLGGGGFLSKVAADSQIQQSLPDVYRGRAFAFYDILYNMASVVAASIVVAFESVDVRALLVASGVTTIAVGIAVHLSMRSQVRVLDDRGTSSR
jgi:MFS family permease